MKYFFALSLILASCLAFRLNNEDQIEGRSFIDPIIKAILEQSRPKLANLTIPDIKEKIREDKINASIAITKIQIKKVDKFVIRNLKSDLVPLRLTNLTLFWDEITASALYDVDIKVKTDNKSQPINVFGKGNAKAKINNLFLTVGANLEYKNNAIQIKPKGLFGFDVRISKADVSFSSLMNSTQLGSIVGNIISRNLPSVIDEVKKPLFDAFHDDIIVILNKFLKNNGTKLNNEEDSDENTDIFYTLFDLPNELDDSSSLEEESYEVEN